MSEEGPARRSSFARLMFGWASRPEQLGLELQPRVEEILLGGPRRYSLRQLAELVGLGIEETGRLWRSLGFPEVGPDEVVFTEGDRKALARLQRLRQKGLVTTELEEAVTRSVGMAMAGLADWQVEMLYRLVDYGNSPPGDHQILRISDQVIPLLREMQTFVWRRHLAASAGRLLASLPESSQTRTLTIGFADVVGFTRATRQLNPAELTELIENFQAEVSEVVASGGGRVVKTVGDELLFVADEPADGAEIALALLDRVAESPALPQLRIGLAVGPVVTRFGDVYGEAVNIAARLTTNARPGQVLVDRNLAASVQRDERVRLKQRRPLVVRGYRHLQPWRLTRARQRSAHPTSTDDPAPA